MKNDKKNNLFTDINLEDTAFVSGGNHNDNVFEPFDFHNYHRDLYRTIAIPGFNPALMGAVYQGSFPAIHGAITSAFSNGSSSFDGINTINDIVNSVIG